MTSVSGKPRLWSRMSGSEVALCTATGTPSTVTGASPGGIATQGTWVLQADIVITPREAFPATRASGIRSCSLTACSARSTRITRPSARRCPWSSSARFPTWPPPVNASHPPDSRLGVESRWQHRHSPTRSHPRRAGVTPLLRREIYYRPSADEFPVARVSTSPITGGHDAQG